MFFKEGTDRNGSTLVKENQHQRPADEGVSSRLRAANSITALTWLRSKPSNQFIMSSTLAPASKFSKMTVLLTRLLSISWRRGESNDTRLLILRNLLQTYER